MVSKTFSGVVILVSLALLVWVQSPHAESAAPREYLIKAAFLYNFAKFVDWPDETFAETPDTINLCILGTDPFGDSLESIEGKAAMGRRLVIRRTTTVGDVDDCHILFISASEKRRLPSIIEEVGERHILSVSDMEGFAQRGGIINLVTKSDRIRFAINVEAAERAGLKISSKLLNLAIIVDESNRKANDDV